MILKSLNHSILRRKVEFEFWLWLIQILHKIKIFILRKYILDFQIARV